MAALPPVLAPKYKTFAELVSDPNADPCNGNYQRLMQRFAGTNDQMTVARLMDQVIGTAGTVPHAFFCTHHYRIYCIHNLSKYAPAWDGTVTPWDEGIFGFLGEVTAGCCASIRIPPEVFAPCQVRSYTVAYMRDHIDDLEENQGLFDIPPQGHGESSVVITRGIVVLPSKYVALFLRGRGFTPKKRDLLIPLLVDDDQLDDCSLLIDWLRAASTASGREQDAQRLLPLLFNLNFNNPPADEYLLNHRMRIMKLLLPGLSQLSDGIETPLPQWRRRSSSNQMKPVRRGRPSNSRRNYPSCPHRWTNSSTHCIY
jgi:hypothetical protein